MIALVSLFLCSHSLCALPVPSQVLVLAMLAVQLAQHRGRLTPERLRQCAQQLSTLPDLVQRVLQLSPQLLQVSKVAPKWE